MLTGSAAFAAQGWPVQVHDLDIQTTGSGARLLGAAWQDRAVLPVAWRETRTVRSWFGRFDWDEGTVEVMGDLEHPRDDGSWSAPAPLRVLCRAISCEGPWGEIPVLPLRYEADAYRRMGRTERASELLAWAEAGEAPGKADGGWEAGEGQELVRALADAAHARGLLPAGTRMDGPTAFRLVRDLPYERPTDNRPRTLLREWRGTCSGKHRLLGHILSGLGYRTRLMIATYRYDLPHSASVLPGIAPIVQQGPVPDVHNFLEVADGGSGRWAAVDATWPTGAEPLGFSVNRAWCPGEPQDVACVPPFHAWEVPPEVDPDAYKADVVRTWCGDDLGRREALIAALSGALRTPRLAPVSPQQGSDAGAPSSRHAPPSEPSPDRHVEGVSS